MKIFEKLEQLLEGKNAPVVSLITSQQLDISFRGKM
jgi:hypothetical protein